MSQRSILVVDDDVKLVELLELYFQKDGFIVYTANEGLSAIENGQGQTTRYLGT